MPPMGDNSMMGGMMTICMIASTLFALVILICMVVQTAVQVKLLGEVRKLRGTSITTGRNDVRSQH